MVCYDHTVLKGLIKMDIKIRIMAFITAAAIAAAGLCGCSKEIAGDKSNNSEASGSVSTPPTATVSDNVPMNTISKKDDSNQTAPSQNNNQSTPATASQSVAEMTQTPESVTNPPVSSHNIASPTADTDSNGLIIDDYRQDIDITNEDSDGMYSAYGLSRSERSSYYSSISQECDLPIIHVSTENKEEVLEKEYYNCFVEIFNCEDEYVKDAVSAQIKVRGNASAYYGDKDQLKKKGAPYRIKFTNKQSVLGLNDNAKCKSWVLLKTYETGVRDHLAFTLARAINQGKYYASDSRFVQVYINEDYKGIYLLCEQSQANPNRVAINECEPDYTGTDIGYFVELDNYSYEEKWRFMLNYNKESITDFSGTSRTPKSYYYSIRNDIYSEEQKKFIERYFEVAYEIPMRAIKYGEFYRLNDDFTLTLAQDEFSSAEECVSQVLDLESFVDMYITYEIVVDQDVGGGSFFFAVDFGNVSMYKTLTCVCPWDFSWAYTDNYAESNGGLYSAKFKSSSFVEKHGDRSNPWLILLYSADWFQELVKEKWQERYPAILETVEAERDLVNTYKSDFNKDGSSRSSRANTTINWTENRIKYLNTLWG